LSKRGKTMKMSRINIIKVVILCVIGEVAIAVALLYLGIFSPHTKIEPAKHARISVKESI
jgi:hypothetical protein